MRETLRQCATWHWPREVALRGLIQDGVAERLHMAMKNYQCIEYGQNITLKMLARVANALGVSPADLLEEPRSR